MSHYEVLAGDDLSPLYSGEDGGKALTLYHECVILRRVNPGQGGQVMVFENTQCIREYHPQLGESLPEHLVSVQDILPCDTMADVS